MSNGILMLFWVLISTLPSCFNKILCMWQFFKVGDKVTQAWAAEWPSDHWSLLRIEIWSSCSHGTVSWLKALPEHYPYSITTGSALWTLPCPMEDTTGHCFWHSSLPELPLAASPLRGRTSREGSLRESDELRVWRKDQGCLHTQ